MTYLVTLSTKLQDFERNSMIKHGIASKLSTNLPRDFDNTFPKTVNKKYKIGQDSNCYINVYNSMLFLFYILIIVNFKHLLTFY